MAFKIYTKTGDKGTTSLFGGRRLPKYHARIESYGTVDELNSHIGMLRDWITDEFYKDFLKEIQDRLFTVGSNLASDPDKDMLVPDLINEDVEKLEKLMDKMDEQLEPLKNFILPGGHQTVSQAHICRTVCRRAERLVTELQTSEPVPEIVIVYLNRLSDFFFTLSRKIAKDLKVEEVVWNPRK